MSFTNVEKCDRKAAKIFAGELRNILDGKLLEAGMNVGKINTKYDDADSFTIKITFEREGGVPLLERDFRNYADMYHLNGSDFGRELELHGATYKIIGLKIRARKRPIIMERISDGKRFVFTEHAIQGAIEHAREQQRETLEQKRIDGMSSV